MTLTKRILGVSLILLLGFYTIWSNVGRTPSLQPIQTRIERTLVDGVDSNKGNILGIQPWMSAEDYASADRFREKIESYLLLAEKKGFLNPKTIVVLPEYLGTWLVVVGEKESIYRAARMKEAMENLVLSNFFSFVWNWIQAKAEDKVSDAVFRMKSKEMLVAYQNTFSGLSRKFSITIVAGSILLPEPFVKDGFLRIGNGALQNGSFVFLPDGKVAENSSLKIFPVDDEKPFVRASTVENLRIVSTPAGKLGILVCADSWYPEVYETFRKQNVAFVVVPSFVAPNGAMDAIWKGYNGSENPSDIQRSDIGRIREGEAWLKYALAGRISSSGANFGMNVFLRGDLWDLGSDGETIFVSGSRAQTHPRIFGASLVNLWLY
ncbi:carbon-nitrogen hydrolase [Leptospira sp. 201903070]|uniref:Carbon-nitrogen hydrolase n=1 Tax=Leptospira ainlahdjerensis TaxID=2810033 RepID=A0ABS2UBG3_9LEPT|nr:nitrilase-related carbon-nitrogen hydrolase [Leptospira ainlahdjerensis]MBM9577701.1 carbon-nitrogen hydrolase [Leptospira ainlahdjerensis]